MPGLIELSVFFLVLGALYSWAGSRFGDEGVSVTRGLVVMTGAGVISSGIGLIDGRLTWLVGAPVLFVLLVLGGRYVAALGWKASLAMGLVFGAVYLGAAALMMFLFVGPGGD